MKSITYRVFAAILSVIMVTLAGFLILELSKLNVLPMKVFIPLLGILIVVGVLLIVLLNFFGKSMVARIVVVLFSVLYGISCLFGGYYILKTNSLFSKITNVETDSKATVSLIVMKDSSVESSVDLAGETIGVLHNIGTVGSSKLLNALSKEGTVVSSSGYNDIQSMVEALYSGSIPAIVLNESSRTSVTELEGYENFDEETRVVFSTTYDVNANNKANSVSNITSDSFNVLITGSDSRVGLEENSRSDVNMIVTVNPKTGKILLTSIPRDYYVETACDVSDGCQIGALDKITHTGIHGVNVTKKTVEKLMGIEINYTFKVGFESVEKIVDALGGVDVNVTAEAAAPRIGVSEGVQHMNGAQALTFSRERYSYESGDRQRTNNQQAVLMAVINKATSPAILSNYAQLMDALSDTFQTNMSAGEIQSLIQYQISDGVNWQIEQYMVDGTGSSEYCAELGMNAYVMIPNQDTVMEAKNKINNVMIG